MPNHSASLPIYIQISELLTREITAGLYAAGDRLPSELELASKLGVAVGTLRKALSELASRGMLERRQGSGTYVRRGNSTAPIGKSVYEFFKLELLRGGGLPTAEVLSFDKIETLSSFQASFSNQCYRLRRVRLLDGTPAALEEIYFDSKHHPRLSVADLGEALYMFYKERLGFWIATAEDHIGQGFAPDWAPIGFTLKAGVACPRIERVARSSDGVVREYSVTWFDANVCHYVNRMK
jgi:GntR family transcriptional regulator